MTKEEMRKALKEVGDSSELCFLVAFGSMDKEEREKPVIKGDPEDILGVLISGMYEIYKRHYTMPFEVFKLGVCAALETARKEIEAEANDDR